MRRRRVTLTDPTPSQGGPHGEAPGCVQRQRKQGSWWAGAFPGVSWAGTGEAGVHVWTDGLGWFQPLSGTEAAPGPLVAGPWQGDGGLEWERWTKAVDGLWALEGSGLSSISGTWPALGGVVPSASARDRCGSVRMQKIKRRS